jgi:hypothetical protein
MIQEKNPEDIHVGSHWNRAKLQDEGTGIHWNTDRQMWEVKIVRHGGYFESLEEAMLAMKNYLRGTSKVIVNGARLMAMLKDYESANLLIEAIEDIQEKIDLE